MNEPINVVRLRQPDDVDDPLTDAPRSGARRLLAQAVELKAEAFLAGIRVVEISVADVVLGISDEKLSERRYVAFPAANPDPSQYRSQLHQGPVQGRRADRHPGQG